MPLKVEKLSGYLASNPHHLSNFENHMAEQVTYTEDNIRADWKEHIRMRPGMYIGKLGDGKDADDGIYVLLKEVIDNSIDEYTMGHGRTVEVVIKDDEVRVRDMVVAFHLARLWIVCPRSTQAGSTTAERSKSQWV